MGRRSRRLPRCLVTTRHQSNLSGVPPRCCADALATIPVALPVPRSFRDRQRRRCGTTEVSITEPWTCHRAPGRISVKKHRTPRAPRAPQPTPWRACARTHPAHAHRSPRKLVGRRPAQRRHRRGDRASFQQARTTTTVPPRDLSTHEIVLTGSSPAKLRGRSVEMPTR